VSLVSTSSSLIFLALRKTRETSNKALNAINQISLVPFLMSFLGAKDVLPISAVASAGMSFLLAEFYTYSHYLIAHCLYVLTDDNPPAIHEVRSYGAYTACLLAVAKPDENQKLNGKAKTPSDDREVTLQVLCSGIALSCIICYDILISL
jgi:hypothetical protein